jgi:phosphonate degradation associated HDIG domain protein
MTGRHSQPSEIIARLADIFARLGAHAYAGEALTVSQHMLQTAARAQAAEAPDTLVAAALLHDIGHLIAEDAAYSASDTEDKRHDELGANMLQGFFPPSVTECIRLHVAAKRYLCATDAGYFDTLSAASQRSLRLQGGAMSDSEIDAFRRLAYYEDAVALRRWDDGGKIIGLPTMNFDSFRPLLERIKT